MKCTLAAIDIGSNGARLLIKAFDDEAVGLERVRKLMFVRVPLSSRSARCRKSVRR